MSMDSVLHAVLMLFHPRSLLGDATLMGVAGYISAGVAVPLADYRGAR